MHRSATTVVAIPARDEADRIGACLRAVLSQLDAAGGALDNRNLRVVVLANNCRDGTAKIAAAVDPRIKVVSVDLRSDDANVGHARRLAMDLAATELPGGEGVICTTDADSRPRADWIVNLWAALDGGAEAVAGAIDLEPCRTYSAPRGREACYSALQAEIEARLDPEPYNPWPNHLWAWGANLAVTGAAYRRVGGLPPAPLAEDRAFVDQLRRHDVPVRHSLAARVWTSARSLGRAPGGLADLIADHAGPDLAACDAILEPALDAARRAILRFRFRAVRERGEGSELLAVGLRLPLAEVAHAADERAFGEGWARLERASPRLVRRGLTLEKLPREIVRARRLLAQLRPDTEAGRCDTALAAGAGLWSADPEPL